MNGAQWVLNPNAPSYVPQSTRPAEYVPQNARPVEYVPQSTRPTEYVPQGPPIHSDSMNMYHSSPKVSNPVLYGPKPRQSPGPIQQPKVRKVILIAGYRLMGKTTVAKELAEKLNYEYVSVSSKNNTNNSNSCINVVQRFEPLKAAIEKSEGKKGIVIDDAVNASRFDPYFINDILSSAKMSINYVILFNTEPAGDRIKLSDIDKQTHPESFEFGQMVEGEGGSEQILVYCDAETPQEVVDDAFNQLRAPETSFAKALKLPRVEFIPGATLVTDPVRVEAIIRAEAEALNTDTCEYFYCFPYVMPNFILDYSLFTKMALLMKNYLIVPWIWSVKISLIGYDGSVFIHVPSYQLIFNLNNVSPELNELCKKCKNLPVEEENENKGENKSPSKEKDEKFVFSLEAVMKDNRIYISDMMYLAGQYGSEILLRKRVELLRKYLSNLSGPISLVKHYPVSSIKECLEAYKHVASGVLFVNPDGMVPGKYDSRNVLFYHAETKKIPLRLWNGTNKDSQWIFDAYALDNNQELMVEKTKVVISNDDVDKYGLNNGHIVECVPSLREDSHLPKKHRQLEFVSRCNWEFQPATLYYHAAIIKPKDPGEIFIDACSMIKCEDI